MRKILALILTIIMVVGIFALPVMAEEDAVVLTEDFGKVKIQGKVQSNGSTAFAVRSSFGESETQDIIQYFVRDTAQSSNGMEQNPAFDFYGSQELVSKTSSTIFSSGTKGGGDERAPVELSGFGWIGASHGTTCGVTVTSTNHGVTYSSIGNVYKDPAGVEWVLLRVSDNNTLVFISKNLKLGNDTKPTFHSTMGATLTNVSDAEDVIKVDSYKASQQLRPAYEMEVQNIYVVNGDEKTLVETIGTTYEGDYVLVEEKYTVMNPAYVAQAIIEGRPQGGYTENPSLAVGKPLVTFDLQQIYNADGTVIHNWENTFHQNATMTRFGGIQFNHSPTHIYLPNTKAFSKTAYDSANNSLGTQTMDFSNIASASVYPDANLGTEGWEKTDYVPHRRLDFHADAQGKFTKVFVGGLLPVYDNANETRLTNTDTAFYMYKSRKAYYHSVAAKLSSRVGDLTNHTIKGSGYKKYVSDFDGDGTASYYSVPYFSDGDNSRYMYFDLYKPGVTKKYDISAYLGTYSISELEKTANLDYEINYEKGILTVSSKENNQKSADSLVLKAKYVGESVPAVEMKIRALPELYDVSLNDKLTEIADLMESIGVDESDYDPALIAKYNSLLAQKEAYEQAIRDEAANADRVAGLNNRYENIELYLFEDVFATDEDFKTTGWYDNKNYVINKTGKTDNILTMKGFESSMSGKGYPQGKNSYAFRADALNEVANLKNGVFTTTNGVPFKLGTIKTENGKMGANVYIPRATYNAADYYTGSESVNTMSKDIYTADGSYQVTKAQWPINKKGINAVNLLMTGLMPNNGNRFYDIYVKYAGETANEHHYALAGKFDSSFEGSIKLITKDAYNRIKEANEYAATMTKLGDMTVNDLNALTGYTPDASVTVDTSKKISSSNYSTAQFNAATGFNVTSSNINTYWNQCTEINELYKNLKANSKYQQILKENPVTLESLSANLDLDKITAAYTGVNVALPKDSTKFVPARKYTTGETDYTTYAANTSIPVNPDKTVESIRLEANTTDPATMILGSGGFYEISEYNVQTGMLMLNYDGKSTVNIDGTDYVMFMTVQRECSDSMLLSMTAANELTWQDKIDALNGKIEALNVETTSKAQLNEIKEEINALLAANTNIVYVKDFSEEARNKIIAIEEYLKTHFSEEERLEMLSERTYNYIDIAPDVDLFATWQDTADLARFFKAVSGTNTQSFDKVDYNGGEIFDWIPQTKSDGTNVTGKEPFYSKGLKGINSAFAGTVLLIESLIAPEGTKTVTAARVDTKTDGTNKDYIEGTYIRKDSTKKIDQSHIISRLDEDGFVTIANGDMKHKVGPLKADAVSPNARSTVKGNATVVTDAKGTSLDLMLITNNVNYAYYTSSKLGVYTTSFVKEDGTITDIEKNAGTYAVPKAGLQQIIINYADGEQETKYMLSVDNTIANYQPWYSENPVENSIVYAPKYDADGKEIVYDENSFYINSAETDFKYLTKYNVKNDNIKSEMVQPADIKFVNENIFMSDNGMLAEVVANQQHASINSGGKFAAIASIPLKNKPLASLTFARKNEAALDAEHSIKIETDQKDGSGNARAATAALVPVEIEGASDDFVYFAYCGRLGDGTFLVSATVSSSKEDIVKKANEEILKAETAEEAEAVMVEYIDNLYIKYRDISAEARAYYEELTGSKGTIRLTAESTGYKVTAFTAEAANKPYIIILASYDDKDNFMSAQKIDGTTKDAIYYVQNFASVPEGTAKVRAFLWENFSTLIPLAGNVAEIEIK